jgi:hypothetical protein
MDHQLASCIFISGLGCDWACEYDDIAGLVPKDSSPRVSSTILSDDVLRVARAGGR